MASLFLSPQGIILGTEINLKITVNDGQVTPSYLENIGTLT